MVNFTLFFKTPSKGGYTLAEVITIAETLGIDPIRQDGIKKTKRELAEEVRDILYTTQDEIQVSDHAAEQDTGPERPRGTGPERPRGTGPRRWFWAGILPVARRGIEGTGETVYLLAKEQTGEWSIIGGGKEKWDISPLINAAREGYEETMGFLGTEWELIRDLMVSSQSHYLNRKFFLYTLPMEYEPNLPKYFGRVFDYFRQCSGSTDNPRMPYQIASCPSGYFELTDVAWFTKAQILEMRGQQGSRCTLKKVARQVFKSLWADSDQNKQE